jgi:hypothetical protein
MLPFKLLILVAGLSVLSFNLSYCNALPARSNPNPNSDSNALLFREKRKATIPDDLESSEFSWDYWKRKIASKFGRKFGGKFGGNQGYGGGGYGQGYGGGGGGYGQGYGGGGWGRIR